MSCPVGLLETNVFELPVPLFSWAEQISTKWRESETALHCRGEHLRSRGAPELLMPLLTRLHLRLDGSRALLEVTWLRRLPAQADADCSFLQAMLGCEQ
jgi:hypothetical protein